MNWQTSPSCDRTRRQGRGRNGVNIGGRGDGELRRHYENRKPCHYERFAAAAAAAATVSTAPLTAPQRCRTLAGIHDIIITKVW